MTNEHNAGNMDMANEVTQEQHTQVLVAIAKVEAAVTINSNQNEEIIRRLGVINGSVAKLFEKDDDLQRELVEHRENCPVADDVRAIKHDMEKLNLEEAEKRGEQIQRNKVFKGLQPLNHYIVLGIIILILSQGPNIVHFFFPHLGVKPTP